MRDKAIRRRERKIRRLVRSLVDVRVTNAGQRGTLVRCEKCGGDGLLHKLDDDIFAAMEQQARDTPPSDPDGAFT